MFDTKPPQQDVVTTVNHRRFRGAWQMSLCRCCWSVRRMIPWPPAGYRWRRCEAMNRSSWHIPSTVDTSQLELLLDLELAKKPWWPMKTEKSEREWWLRNWYIYIYSSIYIYVCVYVCTYLYHIITKTHRNVAGFSESMIWPFKFHGKSMTTGGLRFGKSKNDWQRWKMINTGDSQHQKWWLKTGLESSKIIKIQYLAPLKSIQMEDQAANLWWIDEWIWLTVHFLGKPTTQWFRTAYSLLKLPLWGNYTPVSPGEIWM